ncbi:MULTISPECIES: protein-tyrosine-phosphatase [unclassified Leeuwenhoekiella]|uniref:protein-tyrosine-phosphatase n=1 Tax=unclassified Leeuwenhoekiella TaxID=2615029 RepID=UPI000C5FE720|nr:MULTISPECIES: protein-tyrosine-phosphatase [unclassified Leeuwenhoekiella]MAW95231.1 protein-tyrosine-phosphatase [Leeuwenhoekiella sp.]MBA81846.1 protein-tyrosine-phosphatase [Leeuwenhoekiella sp.]|tara:strand:- start:497 stop:1102 length:606 start_codon:yes stop_codon:yes gene_type:complete
MYTDLRQFIDSLQTEGVTESRSVELQALINYLKSKKDLALPVQLNFICTHNSRRSQLSQIWAQAMAAYFGLDVKTFSGGVEVTAFNKTAVNTLIKQGFKAECEGNENPVYRFTFDENQPEIDAFSKLYDHPINPKKNFAAVMTCSHADENCPFIPGAEARIAVRYEDPKLADGTPKEEQVYADRSKEIATEMKLVFSELED